MTDNPWLTGAGARGASYDRRFEDLAASGHDVHGEANFVESYRPTTVLDAGCGTGRIAIELARRGCHVVGVDLDPRMLEEARRKAPDLPWIESDLADPALPDTLATSAISATSATSAISASLAGRQFDAVVLAGNVLLFVTPGTEGAVLANVARLLVPGGRAMAGYSLSAGSFDITTHDALAAAVGLELEGRWSTWDGAPFGPASTYAVSVHRKGSSTNVGATESGG